MDEITCPLCLMTGRNGVNFFLTLNDKIIARVHRPCGESYIAGAPKGAKVLLLSNEEIVRRERVKLFWQEKFATAKKVAAKNK